MEILPYTTISTPKNASVRDSQDSKFLKAVVECLEEGILILDSLGRVLFSNSAARHIFGVESEDFPDLDLGIPLIQNGNIELDIHVDDELKTVELRSLRRCESEKCTFVVSVRDITHERQLEKCLEEVEIDLQLKFKNQLREHTNAFEEERKKLHFRLNENRFREKRLQDRIWALEEEAESLLNEKQELEMFGHIAGHDLKDSLRSLMLSTDFLVQHPSCRSNSELLTYREMIHRHTSHLMELLKDIQAFTRIHHSEKENLEVSMNAVCEQAVESIHALLEERKAVLKVGHLPWAQAQAHLLSLVFQNLISNAVKFQPEDQSPEIEVFSGRDPQSGQIFIGIRDNGIGMEPKYFGRLFQVFSRLVRREEYTGSGLGLAICRKIIEAHGGEIWVNSKLGSGTTFYFSLPSFYAPEFHQPSGQKQEGIGRSPESK